jgi:hypothetical protein
MTGTFYKDSYVILFRFHNFDALAEQPNQSAHAVSGFRSRNRAAAFARLTLRATRISSRCRHELAPRRPAVARNEAKVTNGI